MVECICPNLLAFNTLHFQSAKIEIVPVPVKKINL